MSSLVVPNAGLKNHHVGLPVYLRGEEQVEKKREEEVVRRRNGFCLGRKEVAAESSESSSIGAASSSSEEEVSRQEGREAKEEEEVESKRKDGAALGSLDSLEDSLPIKRGLSNFFSGKSKSFASLSDAATATAKDMAKPENPFNKRRRLLMMSSNIRSASYTSLSSRDHTVQEADEEEEDHKR
ncbi:hypothetical protein OPV22_006415 [Ensete ventricosum]|uniref:Uncharacterized protein n=1 Tax=Ensete ventricosum TaxID=4639 RepID=A0AAV8RPN4_ENSVE|nr:hypothetical protein OPV22_006415 [Ensete ventricosum]RZS26230.1 hypothetical protein BHM03_00059548 [Ensete ventricosum]